MNYLNILKKYRDKKNRDLLFYDKVTDRFVKIEENLQEVVVDKSFDLSSLPKELSDRVLEKRKYLDDEKRYLFFPTVSTYDINWTMREYALEKNEELLKIIDKYGFTNEGMNKYFEYVDSLPPVQEEFMRYLQLMERRNASQWVLGNDLKNVDKFKPYYSLYELLKPIGELELWRTFEETDLIKIKAASTTFYISVLGHAFGNKAFNIYFGDLGLSDFQMMQRDETNEVFLKGTLQNVFVVDFDDLENSLPEDLLRFNQHNFSFSKGLYPSFKIMNAGLYPETELDYPTINNLINIMKVFYHGILKALKSGFMSTLKPNELLEIEIDEEDQISLHPWVEKELEEVQDIGIDYQLKPTTCFLEDNQTFEVRCEALNSFFFDGYQRYWVYQIFVLDDDTKDVVFFDQAYYKDKPALETLVESLRNFASEKGFSKHVYASDTVTYDLVLDAIGDGIDIEINESSEEMLNLIEQVNKLAREEELEEEEDYSLSELN